MPKSGRLLLVLSVLSAMPIHAMMPMELPAKTVNAINKIIRAFLWCEKKEARGGNCSVAWTEVCTPKWAGGLGLPNLRWIWHAGSEVDEYRHAGTVAMVETIGRG